MKDVRWGVLGGTTPSRTMWRGGGVEADVAVTQLSGEAPRARGDSSEDPVRPK